MIKKIFIFILCLFPWFLSTFIPLDYSYYNEINKPFFAPPSIFYPIAWTLIYIIIAITIYSVVTNRKIKDIPKGYIISLIINYIFNQSYTIIFFGLKNAFGAFIACLGTLISALFLYSELKLINSKTAKLLYFYIALASFATILSLAIFLLN